MNIVEAVEAAWSKTVQDFEKAKGSGAAGIWTEDTLRLIFFHHFCDQGLDIQNIVAEPAFHLGETEYKPDIIIDIATDDVIRTAAFELKYFNRNWFADWEKLRLYGIIGWDYCYFLGIGSESQCEKIPKLEKKEFYEGAHVCELRGLVHSTSRLKLVPAMTIAADLVKKALSDTPYFVSAFYGAVAIFEDVDVYFDVTAKENKCIVWVKFKKNWNEAKLREVNLDKWVSITSEGKILQSRNFVGFVLLGEFEANTYSENVDKVKRVVSGFLEKMERFS